MKALKRKLINYFFDVKGLAKWLLNGFFNATLRYSLLGIPHAI